MIKQLIQPLLIIGAGLLLMLLSSCLGLLSSTNGEGPYYDYRNSAPIPTHLHPGEQVAVTWSAARMRPSTSLYPATITLAIVLVPEATFRRRLPGCTLAAGDIILDPIHTSTSVGRSYQRSVVIPTHLAPGSYELISFVDHEGLHRGSRSCTSTTVTVTTDRQVRP